MHAKRDVKILQVIASLDMGGAETMILNILRNLGKNIHFDFLVYGKNHGDYEDEILGLGSRVIHICDPKEDGYLAFYIDIKKCISDNGPYDCVHSHTLFNSAFAVMAAHKLKVPIRICHSHSTQNRVHETLLTRLYAYFMRKIINRYSTVQLACSNQAGFFLFGEKEFRESGKVINNGISLSEFAYDPIKRQFMRNKLGINDRDFVIGHVGRFDEVKNHRFIISLFEKVVELDKDSRLILVGDGPEKNIIMGLAAEKSISEYIKFLGKRSDVNDIMQAMDIFVLPSLFEGLGIVLIEAQACGLPCVASSSVPEICNVSQNYVSMNISESPVSWANEALKFRLSHKHMDIDRSKIDPRIKDFDILNTVNLLTRIYKRGK